jgi:UbiD family decarboxylase
MEAYGIRDYLSQLESDNQLWRIPTEVDMLDDMGAFIARADYEGVEKALLFEHPKGFGSPVLANTVGGSFKRIAEGFGVTEEGGVPKAAQKMGELLRSGGIPPVMVERDKAPCKQVIKTGDQVNLAEIPILRYNPQDGEGGKNFVEGRFIGSLACSKPTGGHNLSYHRFEVQGKNHGTAWIFRLTGDAKSIEEAWGDNRRSGKDVGQIGGQGIPNGLRTRRHPRIPACRRQPRPAPRQ